MTDAANVPEGEDSGLDISMLIHELWYPVSTLRALALSLTQRWSDLEEGSRFELAQRIEQETKRLRDLAEQTETLGGMEGSRLGITLRLERAIELLREATEAVGELGGRLRVHVGPEADDLMVRADRGRVLQILRNLLSNAEKYGMSDTEIELRLDCSGEFAAFTVLNRGSGIGPEEAGRLFQPFSRLSQRTSTADGVGLGLYISRRLAEAQGGYIGVESADGETAFTFTLPLAEDGP